MERKLPEDIVSSLEQQLQNGEISREQADNIITTLKKSPRITREVIETIKANTKISAEQVSKILNWKESTGEIEVLTSDDNVPLRAILEQIMFEGEFLGMGELADVYRGFLDGEKQFCAKKIARTTQKSLYSNSIEEEMRIQQKAFQILGQAHRAEQPLAHIPEPLLYVRTSDDQKYLVMEYVPGKTLWRMLLEQIIQNHPLPAQYTLDDLLKSSDAILESVILDILALKDVPPRDQYNRIVRHAVKNRFLDASVLEQTQQAIRTLNQNHLYHRDLHVKNLMITPEGKVFIIDFGSSIQQKTDSPYEETRLGDNLRYTPDDSILNLLKTVCIQSEDTQIRENEQKENRDRQDRDRILKWLKQREHFDIENESEKIADQSTNGAEFVAGLTSSRLGGIIMKYLHKVDVLEKIVKIMIHFENLHFQSTTHTIKFFLELAQKNNVIPLLNLVNKLHN